VARGWESKAVESQIESAEERKSRAQAVQISRERYELEQQIASVELSRTRVLQDLAAATNPRYKELLQRSLAYLDTQVGTLRERLNKPDHHG